MNYFIKRANERSYKMKTKKEKIKKFILDNGYGECGERLTEYAFSQLPEEEKCKYNKVSNSNDLLDYSKPDIIPEISDNDLAFLCKIEDNTLLRAMQNDIKIIKGCALFFTVLTALSLTSSIILYIMIFSA